MKQALPLPALSDREQEKLWDRVLIGDGCWDWQRATNGVGYGLVRFGKHQYLTHRLAYQLLVGPIPDGLQLDHLCRNRACCNPSHLEPVTRRENILRGIAPPAVLARMTECKNGHAFTPENTLRYRMRKGYVRRCRICDYWWRKARRDAKRKHV